jgi:hypothetical protein
VNRRRFGPDDMLYSILENTARELGWLDDSGAPPQQE